MTQHNLDLETNRVVVSGKVQGVGYRFSAVRQAHELGVTGWVRNQHDGTVEAVLQGTPDQIDQMLSWMRYGPPGARVENVDAERLYDESRRFDSFQQL